MIRFVHSVLLMLACSVLLLSGCGAGQPETAERTRTLEHPLTCIVVLPAVADPEDTEAAAGQLDEELLAGAEAMNELLRQELAEVRKTRSATEFGEYVLGSYCVGSPVFDATGKPVAGVGVTGLASRLDEAKLPELRRIVRECAERISTAIGAQPIQ